MASSLTNTGARFNDHLKGLQNEFDLLSNVTSTNSWRPSRFNVYLQRLKGEFDIMSIELDSLQKERKEYEAIIEAQTKELEDVRRNAVCVRCGEGPTSACGILASSQTSASVTNLMAEQPSCSTQPTTQPVALSQPTNITSPERSTSNFDTIIFNDQVHTISHPRSIRCVKFSRDGTNVVAGCDDGNAYIYDVQTGALTCTLRNPSAIKSSISSLCFSHDGQYLAIASDPESAICIWEVNTKELRQTFRAEREYILSVSFSPNGQLLLSASYNVRLWNNGSAKILTNDDSFGSYSSAVFSPDGRYIAASHYNGMVRIWEVHTCHLVRMMKAHAGAAISVGFMPDGECLVSGGDVTLRFWDLRSLLDGVVEPKREFSGHKLMVLSLAISPDGRWIASGSCDDTVRIWDTRNAAEPCIFSLTHKSYVQTVDFSPTDCYLASGAADGTMVIRKYSSISPGASGLDGSDLPPL